MNTANVFDVKRFGLNDGGGIRTVLFLKGCPLRCRWCQNPEGLSKEIGLWCVKTVCVGCGGCVFACPTGALRRGAEGIAIDLARCSRCGKCVYACPTGAMRLDAVRMSVGEALSEIQRDRVFYGGDGGVTLSGGECTATPAFCLELLSACRAQGIASAIETCMYAPPGVLRGIALAADEVIGDIKLMDTARHKAATGVGNGLILENFRMLSGLVERLVIRLPLIPGYTADPGNIRAIAAHVAQVRRDIPLELINFNPLCESKYETLGAAYITNRGRPFSKGEMEGFAQIARESGLTVRYEGMK